MSGPSLDEIEPWRAAMTELAQLPNVAVKLSGLVTEATPDWSQASLTPYAQVLLDTFTPSRILFGSDWPGCLLAADYQRVIQVAASDVAMQVNTDAVQLLGG
jgi:L-fuconolactonase